MNGWYFLASALVLLAPGGMLLAWLPGDSGRGPAARKDFLSTLADAVALSIALLGLLALWLFVARIRVGAQTVIGLYAVCLLLLLAGLLRRAIRRRTHLPDCGASWAGWLGGLLSAAVLAALILWRLYQARFLQLPVWVDPVHHTLIVRMILEYGGVPRDFSPYIQAPFFYHYGFHLIAALFAFFTRLPPAQAVLWFGQVLNALVAVSVYRLAAALFEPACPAPPVDAPAGMDGAELTLAVRPARRFWGISTLPLLAALLVEFVSQMPAYYLTWGRYTLLTGLILLGPALAAALDVWRSPRWRTGWLKLALLIGGLCIAHYFALLLAGLFLLLLGLSGLVEVIRRRVDWKALVPLTAFTLVGVLLASPWVWRVWWYNTRTATIQVVDPLGQDSAAMKGAIDYLKYIFYLVGPRRDHLMLGMAGVGLLASLRHPRLRLLAAWTALLVLFSSPWGLRFGPFRPDHFVIVLFFPAGILLASLIVDGAQALGAVAWPWLGKAALAFTAALFLIWGVKETGSIVNNSAVFVNQADVAALEWVKANTPPDARFYINSVLWMGVTYRGVDGGYWLEPFTGRASLIPPVFYTTGEQSYYEKINQWAQRAAKLKGCTPEFWSLARDANLSYVYLHQGTGTLQPSMLANCPRLQPVYQKDGVYIYRIPSP